MLTEKRTIKSHSTENKNNWEKKTNFIKSITNIQTRIAFSCNHLPHESQY